jgi:hypothetical protein
MDSSLRVNTHKFHARPLEHPFLELASDAKSRDQYWSAITRSQRFVTLSDAAYDIITRRFDFDCDSFANMPDGDAVDHRVANACGLH